MNEINPSIDNTTKALLVDIDSTIPNLALMNISAMIKENEGIASFEENDPTHAYISCIFAKNRDVALSSKKMLEIQYPNIVVDVGGSGVDLSHSVLDVSIPTRPDYSIYPDNDMSIGFSSRGCNRQCYKKGIRCIVPQKEGRYKRTLHPEVWHDPKFKKMLLLDNNILMDKDWFFSTTEWMLEKGLRVDYNQGLDIRLVDEDVAHRIAELKPLDSWHFAFDDLEYRDAVESGAQMLSDAGIKLRNTVWMVYLGLETTEEDALDRCNILRKIGCVPFPMIDGDIAFKDRPRWMTRIKGWCRPEIFFSAEYKDCTRGKPRHQITPPVNVKALFEVLS